MKRIDELFIELDHLDGSEYIIMRTVKAIADDIGDCAANEPDTRTQRRTVLADMAHRLRMEVPGRPVHPLTPDTYKLDAHKKYPTNDA